MLQDTPLGLTSNN